MVTIEIIGFKQAEAHKVESQIFSLLGDQGCIKQLSVVAYNSTSRSAQRIDQPFLKISAVPGAVSIAGAIRKLRDAGFKVLITYLSPVSESIPRIKKKKKEKKRENIRRSDCF